METKGRLQKTEDRFVKRLEEIENQSVSQNNQTVNAYSIESETTLVSEFKGDKKSPTFNGETVWSKYSRQCKAVAECSEWSN